MSQESSRPKRARSVLFIWTDQLRAVDVRTIRRGRWKLNVSGEPELYDLRDDLGEQHNAIRDPGANQVVRDLFMRLGAWQRQTVDSLELPDPTVP